jgi:hypothetical protein
MRTSSNREPTAFHAAELEFSFGGLLAPKTGKDRPEAGTVDETHFAWIEHDLGTRIQGRSDLLPGALFIADSRSVATAGLPAQRHRILS